MGVHVQKTACSAVECTFSSIARESLFSLATIDTAASFALPALPACSKQGTLGDSERLFGGLAHWLDVAQVWPTNFKWNE